MKLFKITDLILQIALLVYGIVYCYIKSPGNFIIIYFLIGGVQLLSFAAHHFLEYSWIHTQHRKRYGQFLFWIIVAGLASLVIMKLNSPLLLFYLFGLLILSPFLAVWYFIIGLKELSSIYKRELVHLK